MKRFGSNALLYAKASRKNLQVAWYPYIGGNPGMILNSRYGRDPTWVYDSIGTALYKILQLPIKHVLAAHVAYPIRRKRHCAH